MHLPLQVHVVHELIAELLHLRPLFGRHRVHHGLHGSHALGHLLQQFFDCFWVLGKELAELLHEVFEAGIIAPLMLLEHLVERCHHVFHASGVFGAHVFHGTGHLVDHLLHQLVFELLHQLFESLLRLIRFEVVALELAHLACQVVRH